MGQANAVGPTSIEGCFSGFIMFPVESKLYKVHGRSCANDSNFYEKVVNFVLYCYDSFFLQLVVHLVDAVQATYWSSTEQHNNYGITDCVE